MGACSFSICATGREKPRSFLILKTRLFPSYSPSSNLRVSLKLAEKYATVTKALKMPTSIRVISNYLRATLLSITNRRHRPSLLMILRTKWERISDLPTATWTSDAKATSIHSSFVIGHPWQFVNILTIRTFSRSKHRCFLKARPKVPANSLYPAV